MEAYTTWTHSAKSTSQQPQQTFSITVPFSNELESFSPTLHSLTCLNLASGTPASSSKAPLSLTLLNAVVVSRQSYFLHKPPCCRFLARSHHDPVNKTSYSKCSVSLPSAPEGPPESCLSALTLPPSCPLHSRVV